MSARNGPGRRFWWILGLVLILGLSVALPAVRYFFYAQPPLVLIEAETSFLSYRVQREDLSAMSLQGAEVTDTAAVCREGLDADWRVAAIVRPPVGATVEYRWMPGMVLIRVLPTGDGTTTFENAAGVQCREGAALTFLVPAAVLERAGPLPVLGAGQIGVELGVPTLPHLPPACSAPELEGRRCISIDTDTDTDPPEGKREIPVDPASTSALFSATARLYGRTSVSGGQLYPISGGEFVIPGGSRLEASEERFPFIGSLTLGDDGASLHVQVTTEAESLRLYRAGQNNQAELLATGSVARAIQDPSLGPFLIFMAILVLLLQLALNVRDILEDLWKKP